MNGREGSPSVDKGKRKSGWGSIGLYLDKRKTSEQHGERSNLQLRGFLWTGAGCPVGAPGEEGRQPQARCLGRGRSPQKKVIPSLECCGTGESQQGPQIWRHGEALPQYQGAQSGSLNPSQALGHGSQWNETNCLVCACGTVRTAFTE